MQPYIYAKQTRIKVRIKNDWSFSNSVVLGRGIGALLVSLFSLLPANAATKCGTIDRLITAERLLQALYPGLGDQELTIALGEGLAERTPSPTTARSFGIVLDRPRAPVGAMKQSAPSKRGSSDRRVHDGHLPLSFSFLFAANNLSCYLKEFSNTTTPDTAFDEAAALINSHPEWSDDQGLAALEPRGLRFGPKSKANLIRNMPLSALGRIYGPMRVKRAEFQLAYEHDAQSLGASFAVLLWDVTAEIDTVRTLDIFVEPFGGEIVSITENLASRHSH